MIECTCTVEDGSKSLRKHAYSNILNILPPQNKNLQIKNSDIFSYFCSKHGFRVLVRTARRGGSNGYPQFMLLNRNTKHNVYPCKPQFYYIKVGFLSGSKLYRHVSVMKVIFFQPTSTNIFQEKKHLGLAKAGLNRGVVSISSGLNSVILLYSIAR